jgi:hypothetical protein
MYRLTTISEHLLQDIVDELRKNNELLSQLIPKKETEQPKEVKEDATIRRTRNSASKK